MHNLAVQIAQKSQELAERRRLLELAFNDDTVTDEDYMAMEDAVYDLEDDIADLEERLEDEEESEREGRHGWA